MPTPLTRPQIAWRTAQDIEDGAHVNLGIGMPTMVADHLPEGRDILIHSENGILGMGPSPAPGEEDPDLVNASKKAVSLIEGGVYFHHTDAFVMIRGGHIDLCVLGAFQVSSCGDLANWATNDAKLAPAVGGAMDLALGAKRTVIMMEHCTRAGAPKLVESCAYPLTAAGVVSRVYTDLAVIEITDDGLLAREVIEGLDFQALQEKTAAPLRLANDWRPLTAPAL